MRCWAPPGGSLSHGDIVSVVERGSEVSSVEIARGIRRIGAGLVNSYLIEADGEVTIVDAGAPSYWGDLPAELAAMGRSLADVRSVVLTHGHTDHIGFAERIRRERGTPILVHELDAALARGEVPNPSKGLGPIRIRPLLGFLWFSMTHGLLRIPRITEVSTFGDGATLDVPGSPRVILLPGHTPGSAALHFAGHDALLIGDAIATYSVTTGVHAPRIAPFTADPAMALASLARLEGVRPGTCCRGTARTGPAAWRRRWPRFGRPRRPASADRRGMLAVRAQTAGPRTRGGPPAAAARDAPQRRVLIARAAMTTTVTIAISAWIIISTFARRDSTSVSVGLKAALALKATNR